MKIKEEKLKKSKIRLVIEVEAKELTGYFLQVFEKLSKDVSIPGFRPGKAPRKLLMEAIGHGRLMSEGIDLAISNSYYLAINEKKLIPVCSPAVAIENQPNFGLSEQEIDKNLKYTAEVEIMPEVKLGDFSKVKVKRKDIDEIKKADVEKIILHLRRQKATFLEVNRGAKFGDRVEINYQGFIDKIKKDAMTAKNQPLVLGDKTLIPGFEEEIVGMKKGEEKTFEIKFPKDYHSKDVAGKVAKFEVKLIDLKEVNLPEADDKFAENFGHKNFSDLEIAIEKSLKDEIMAKNQTELESEVLDKVLPYLKVELPEGLIEDEISRIISDMETNLKSRGLSIDAYLKSIKKEISEIRKELQPQAEKDLKIAMLLGEIMKRGNINRSDKDAGKKSLEILIEKVTKK